MKKKEIMSDLKGERRTNPGQHLSRERQWCILVCFQSATKEVIDLREWEREEIEFAGNAKRKEGRKYEKFESLLRHDSNYLRLQTRIQPALCVRIARERRKLDGGETEEAKDEKKGRYESFFRNDWSESGTNGSAGVRGLQTGFKFI